MRSERHDVADCIVYTLCSVDVQSYFEKQITKSPSTGPCKGRMDQQADHAQSQNQAEELRDAHCNSYRR